MKDGVNIDEDDLKRSHRKGEIIAFSHTSPLHTHPLSLSAGLRFEEELEEEVVRFLNEDNSPLLLACEISGSPLPSISFLFNSKPLTSLPRVSVKTEPSSCR